MPITTTQGADYAQGWPAIVQAMSDRFNALPLVGAAHPFIKYVKSNPDDPAWRDEYCVRDSDGRQIVSCLFVDLESIPVDEVSQDDSRYTTSEHKVAIHVHFEFREGLSWTDWQNLLAQITTDLREGDRTFSKTCLTHSLPQEGDSLNSALCGIQTHSSIIRFIVQEARLQEVFP